MDHSPEIQDEPESAEPGPIIDAATQLALARDLFRQAWDLLNKEELSPEDEDRLQQMAHASRYHWQQAGTAQNQAIAEYLISRVYTRCVRPEPAIFHARRSLEISLLEPDVPDFCTTYAYLALAHAYSLTGDPLAEENLRMAREMAQTVQDPELQESMLRELDVIEESLRA